MGTLYKEKSMDSIADPESTNSISSTEDAKQSSYETSDLAKTETELVTYSKYIVVLVLVLVTALGAVITYVFTRKDEVGDYASHFDDFANELLEVSQLSAKNAFATINSMSITISSFAEATDAKWPFVSIPHFESRAQQMLELSGALYISLNPLVTADQLTDWEDYANENKGWVQEGVDISAPGQNATDIVPFVFFYNGTDVIPDPSIPDPYYSPIWQMSPAIYASYFVNFNLFGVPGFQDIYDGMATAGSAILSGVLNLETINVTDPITWPQSYLTAPVFRKVNDKTEIVATLVAVLPWHGYFTNVIPDGTRPIIVVVENTCDQVFTYQVEGSQVNFVGVGDLHDTEYSDEEVSTEFITTDGQYDDLCRYTIRAYPTDSFRKHFVTATPFVYTVIVVMVFFLTSMVFVVYDCLVQQRQERVMSSAQKSDAIVSSLFPAQVRARLMEDQGKKRPDGRKDKSPRFPLPFASTETSNGCNPASAAASSGSDDPEIASKPIADLFPNATVLFADIAGFTAWSSSREPAQVFILLESLYNSFDVIARRRQVFKVETIGDCYLAATGLPEARRDHAEAMARFAQECRLKMHQVVKKLESTLGPDTSDLAIRIGIHSGPVTAGVLRGEKSRFQLFGDTVNTASRIETTGMRDCIHLSSETAHLLIAGGKADWIELRDEKVSAKGKGEMQTYWLKTDGSRRKNKSSSQQDNSDKDCDALLIMEDEEVDNAIDKLQRLVDWNVEALSQPLKLLVGDRDQQLLFESAVDLPTPNDNVIEDVQEVINFQPIADEFSMYEASLDNQGALKLPPDVMSELRDFVSVVASLYKKNDFHNFEHASHVVQSIAKLFAQISKTDNTCAPKDPLTQFATLFAALIHDIDHPGVSNVQLVQEQADMAITYKNQSVAEQNSFAVGWRLLNNPLYKNLRAAICSCESDADIFHHVVANAIMATDIMDKELATSRKEKWEAAFREFKEPQEGVSTLTVDEANRRATVLIEHAIQASDISHTMQHWQVYLKWNRRLFFEMYHAFKSGRAKKDPSVDWYEGELKFFDFYVIPLAKKLKDCRYFGATGDEYLLYAESNRKEWETKGQEVVHAYLHNIA